MRHILTKIGDRVDVGTSSKQIFHGLKFTVTASVK